MAVAGTGLDAVSMPPGSIGRTPPPPTPSSLMGVGPSSPYPSAPPSTMQGRSVPTFSGQGPPSFPVHNSLPPSFSGQGPPSVAVAPAERFSATMPPSMSYPVPSPPGTSGSFAAPRAVAGTGLDSSRVQSLPPSTMQQTMMQSVPTYGPRTMPPMMAPPQSLGPSMVQVGPPPVQMVQHPTMMMQPSPIQYMAEQPVPDTALREDGWFSVDHSGARVEPHWMGGEWWLTAPVDYKGLEKMPQQWQQAKLNRVDDAVQELDDTGRIPNLPQYYHAGKECPIS